MSYAETRNGKPTGVHIGEVYRKINGKPKTFRRRFKTKKDADGYEMYVKLTGEEPPTLENTQSTGAPTFREVCAMARKMKGPREVWDLDNDETLVQRLNLVEETLGHFEITQMGEDTTDVMKARLDKIMKGGKPITDSTKNRYLTVMSAVLHCAVIKKLIPIKPEVRQRREKNAKRAILTHEGQDEVILRLMRAAGNVVEAKCVEFLIESGLRRGELCGNKRRRKAPMQPHQITIEPDPQDGSENGWVTLGGGGEGVEQTKNNSDRRVYVRAALAKEIKAIILSGHLPLGDKLLDNFKSARDRAGYPKNLVIHSLRHTRNTRLASVEPDVQKRMKIMGHRTAATNEKYHHIFDADQLAAAKKLEKRAGDLSEKSSAQVVDIGKMRDISKAV